jgi:DNA polymerase
MLFLACDLSTIEARIVAWLPQEEGLLTRFRNPKDDIYSWFASEVYPGVAIAKGGPNAHLRALGKACVLGLGFGIGLVTFGRQVRAQQLPCTVADIERAFATYQSSFTRIKALRKELFASFERATKGWSSECGPVRFRTLDEGPSAPTVIVELPTGRCLYYRSVQAVTEWTEWGMRTGLWFAPAFGSKGKAAAAARRHTRRRFSDGVVRHRLTPQVIVENVVQAIARDLMVHQMLELERLGLRVAWHAHDEIVVLVNGCACTEACGSICPWTKAAGLVKDVMSRVPATLPRLDGLPLNCEINRRVRTTYSA